MKKNQMEVSFFASNGGRQTDLIFDIKDQDNQFFEVELYFNFSAMRQLERVVKKILRDSIRQGKPLKIKIYSSKRREQTHGVQRYWSRCLTVSPVEHIIP